MASARKGQGGCIFRWRTKPCRCPEWGHARLLATNLLGPRGVNMQEKGPDVRGGRTVPQVLIRMFWSISWASSGYFAGAITGMIWFFPSSTSAALKPEQFSQGSCLVMEGKLSAGSESVAPQWPQLCPWLLLWLLAHCLLQAEIALSTEWKAAVDNFWAPCRPQHLPPWTVLWAFAKKEEHPVWKHSHFCVKLLLLPFSQLPNFWDVSAKWSSDINKCCF